MKFETIKDNKKRIGATLGIVGTITIIGITAFTLTRASYKQTQSVPLIKGNISYNKSDLEIVAIKLQQNDGTYSDATSIPTSGYKLNTDIEKSYCKVGTTTNKVDFKYENGTWYIKAKEKGSKCYLIFDKGEYKTLTEMILEDNGGIYEIKRKGTPDFSKAAITDEGMYAMEDDDGVSYYFRGAVTNNYVKFANKYWRIIRINGDGTIRLIYDGTAYHANGTSTLNSVYSNQVVFNNRESEDYMAEHLGFTYARGSKRGTGISSPIISKLNSFYYSISSYSSFLSDSGFCGDRTSTTTNGGIPNNTGGTGTTNTYYGAYYRLYKNKIPTLKCATINYGSGEVGNKADVYTKDSLKGNGELTYPVGLISADEVALAGEIFNDSISNSNQNKAYYLYNGMGYWTMTPFYNSAISPYLLIGDSTSDYPWEPHFIRPVINIDSSKINNVSIDSNGAYVIS